MMRRIITTLLLISFLLSLSACSSESEKMEEPYLDPDFVTSFPFTSEQLSDAQNWVKMSGNYKTKRTDELNREIILAYNPNDVWNIVAIRGAGSGAYGIDGFLVTWYFTPELGVVEMEPIYQEIIDELTSICGNSIEVNTHDNGEIQKFQSNNLKIKVSLYHYGENDSDLSIEMYVEE